MKFFLFACLLLNSLNSVSGQGAAEEWLTRFEKSGFKETSTYDETKSYYEKLAEHSEYAVLKSIGRSPQGREILMLVVSKGEKFDRESIKGSNKLFLLIQSGIHAGEINGKDASTIFLRELLVENKYDNFLDHIIYAFIPIFNVDGHERRGPYNRINQDGPEEMGWRVTSQNLNLNRDYMKADTPEMKAFLKFYNEWMPDFYVDIHSTNGADFQYTTTFTIEKHGNSPEPMADWVRGTLNPYLLKEVAKKDYLISPFVGFVGGNVRNGMRDWIALPRFSNGYAALRNRPGLLIEVHQMKPYRERVYSSKAFIETISEYICENKKLIKEVIKNSEQYILEKYSSGKSEYPISFKLTEEFDWFKYKGIEFDSVESRLTGGKIKKYNGSKFEEEVKYFNRSKPVKTVSIPNAYIVPREYSNLIDIMKLHGIKVKRIERESKISVERIKFNDVSFASRPYEGRFQPSYKIQSEIDTVITSAGEYWIDTDQINVGALIYLLEPESRESFVKWGFMNQIFERKEYFEIYSMEPVAERMIESDPALLQQFEERVNEDSSMTNAYRRLNFFYTRSPYYDKTHNVYPVLRVTSIID